MAKDGTARGGARPGTGPKRKALTITKEFTINKAKQTLYAQISGGSIPTGSTNTIVTESIGTLTFSSSDTSVATVSSKGVVTGVKSGTATIYVKAAETDNYEAAEKTVTVTVVAGQAEIKSLTNVSN